MNAQDNVKPAPKGRVYPTPAPEGSPVRGSFDFGSTVVGVNKDGTHIMTQDGRQWQAVTLRDGSLVYDPVVN